MMIGILHLTDLHIKENTNLQKKIESLATVINNSNQYNNIKKIYIAISGDLAHSGYSEEYNNIKTTLDSLLKKLKIDSKIIMVPGNHDCNFKKEDDLRKLLLKNVSYDSIGIDYSMPNSVLSTQDDFWDFYEKYNPIPKNKMFFSIEDFIDGKKIQFNCYNTAWMSSLEEKVGELFFPTKLIPQKIKDNSDLIISIFHHPLNWLSPHGNNNKKEFEDHLYNNSNILLIGHEHTPGFSQKIELTKEQTIFDIAGGCFSSSLNNTDSEFQFLTINLNEKNFVFEKYSLKNIVYKLTYTSPIISFREIQNNNKDFPIKKDYSNKIEKIDIPLTLKTENLKLSSFFIFPYIEEIAVEKIDMKNKIDSSELKNTTSNEALILSGEEQSGKTSLLKMLFVSFYENGYSPLFIEGSDMKKHITKIIRDSFEEIYSDDHNEYNRYLELSQDKKILFIDDFKSSPTAIESIKKIRLENTFFKIFISIDSLSFDLNLHSIFYDFKHYKINPLNFCKINELIKKYNLFSLKKDLEKNEEQQKQLSLENERETFDKIKELLKDQLLDTYPIYILILLDTLNTQNFDLEKTSYGSCYSALITLALVKKGKVPKEEETLGSYLNFLEHFSYYLFKNNKNRISDDEFHTFYIEYKKDYMIGKYELLKNSLIKSLILKESKDQLFFGYKYISYFLTAKYIANSEKNKESIIQNLFKNLSIEENANILVFITYHSKDSKFIEEALLNAMLVFEDLDPITLEKKCSLNKILNEISSSMTSEISDSLQTPLEKREEALHQMDLKSNNNSLQKKEQNLLKQKEEIEALVNPFLNSFKAIDILGQIIKNNRGSSTKTDTINNITVLYLTAFRTISYYGKIIEELKYEIANTIKEILEKKIEHKTFHNITSFELLKKIEKDINKFLQFSSLSTCLIIFSRVARSIGVKNLEELFSTVGEEINTPAAKLVSFTINSYHNKMDIDKLKKLKKEFDGNLVAENILRARAQNYISNNYIDYKEKDKIKAIFQKNKHFFEK